MTDVEEQRLKEDCLNYASEHPYQHSILVGLSFSALFVTFVSIISIMGCIIGWFFRFDGNPFVTILIKCLILGAILWGLVCLFPFTHKLLRWLAHGKTYPKNLFMMMIMSGLFIVTVIWTIWLWRYIDSQL